MGAQKSEGAREVPAIGLVAHMRPNLDGHIYLARINGSLSMRYTDRLADARIAPSVGSRGDSYDNALAESVIGLFRTEVIRRLDPWRHLEAVEFATLDWVDWFNHRRLLVVS
jgi:transposase InsO family protein